MAQEELNQAFVEKSITGDLNAMKTLHRKGADINAHKDDSGVTALIYLTEIGHLEGMEYLIEHGADVHAKGLDEWNALHRAAWEIRCDCLEYLLAHGADIHSTDGNMETALHLAARQLSVHCASLLVEKGGDIYVENKDGKTPLDMARNQLFGGKEARQKIIDFFESRIENDKLNSAIKQADSDPSKTLEF